MLEGVHNLVGCVVAANGKDIFDQVRAHCVGGRVGGGCAKAMLCQNFRVVSLSHTGCAMRSVLVQINVDLLCTHSTPDCTDLPVQ